MLVTSVVITILQVFAENYESLAFLRLLNGITNGGVFVLAPALVLEWLVEVGKPQHSGLMYLGVGAGILSSTVLVELSSNWTNGSGRWITAAVVSVLLLIWGFRLLRLLLNFEHVS